MNKIIIRAINAVLTDWAKLDDKHKGQNYAKAVKHLEAWRDMLISELYAKLKT